jgi:hypothetical protein
MTRAAYWKTWIRLLLTKSYASRAYIKSLIYQLFLWPGLLLRSSYRLAANKYPNLFENLLIIYIANSFLLFAALLRRIFRTGFPSETFVPVITCRVSDLKAFTSSSARDNLRTSDKTHVYIRTSLSPRKCRTDQTVSVSHETDYLRILLSVIHSLLGG